jgi:hypothetical protein
MHTLALTVTSTSQRVIVLCQSTLATMMTMGNDIESLVMLGLARNIAWQMVEDITQVRFCPTHGMCLRTRRKLQLVPSGTQWVRNVQVGATSGDQMAFVVDDNAEQQRLHRVVRVALFEFAGVNDDIRVRGRQWARNLEVCSDAYIMFFPNQSLYEEQWTDTLLYANNSIAMMPLIQQIQIVWFMTTVSNRRRIAMSMHDVGALWRPLDHPPYDPAPEPSSSGTMDTGELNELVQAVLEPAELQYAPMSGSESVGDTGESDGGTGAEGGSDSEHPDAPGTPGGDDVASSEAAVGDVASTSAGGDTELETGGDATSAAVVSTAVAGRNDRAGQMPEVGSLVMLLFGGHDAGGNGLSESMSGL